MGPVVQVMGHDSASHMNCIFVSMFIWELGPVVQVMGHDSASHMNGIFMSMFIWEPSRGNGHGIRILAGRGGLDRLFENQVLWDSGPTHTHT